MKKGWPWAYQYKSLGREIDGSAGGAYSKTEYALFFGNLMFVGVICSSVRRGPVFYPGIPARETIFYFLLGQFMTEQRAQVRVAVNPVRMSPKFSTPLNNGFSQVTPGGFEWLPLLIRTCLPHYCDNKC